MDSAISLRPCRPGDAPALAAVAQATFLETYAGVVDGQDILRHCQTVHAPEAYETLLANPAVSLFLAEMAPGASPVGYAMLSPPDLPVALAPGDLELKRIYVLHRLHGAGVGPALLDAAVAAARDSGAGRLLLGAYGGNDRAIAFYRRNGFEQVGVRQFRVGARLYDDVVLARTL